MSSKSIRLIISVVVIGAAFSGLMYMTLASDTEYYKHVDEVMVQPSAWYGKNLQLHGFVVDTVERRPDTFDWRFKIQNKGQVVQATYTGVVPDTFKTGSEVVLKGQLTADGFRVAPNGVM